MSDQYYPKTHAEFLARFSSEEACEQYIVDIRWPDGFVCPKCQQVHGWKHPRGLIECKECGHQSSVISGTVFQGTRTPLKTWFDVMWLMVAQKTGTSAQNIKDMMGFGSYQTAWSILHKLRRVMIRPGRDKLSGIVEVDETFIGGVESGVRGRKTTTKTLVVVATECNGKQIGRVRFRCIPEASRKALESFVTDNIEGESTVITDGWESYGFLKSSGYAHKKRVIAGSGKQAHELLPHVHMVDSLVKRWLSGTHQGHVESKHLQYYLDEFAFRFNRKLSTHRGKLFYRLVQQSVTATATPYKGLINRKH